MAWIRSVTIAPWRMRSARCCTPCTDAVVAERELVSQRAPNGIVLRSGASGEDKRLSVEALDDLRALRLQVAEVVGSGLIAWRQGQARESQRSFTQRGGRAVGADGGAHRKLQPPPPQQGAGAAQRVPLVVVPVSRGEVLIREGDTITPAHVALLGALNENSAVSAWLTAWGRAFDRVVGDVCPLVRPAPYQRYRPDGDLAFMVITLVGMMTLVAWVRRSSRALRRSTRPCRSRFWDRSCR